MRAYGQVLGRKHPADQPVPESRIKTPDKLYRCVRCNRKRPACEYVDDQTGKEFVTCAKCRKRYQGYRRKKREEIENLSVLRRNSADV